MRCRVLLFASLRELAGREALVLELPGPAVTIGELRRAAEQAVPGLDRQVYRVAVDAAYAQDHERVQEGAEVALLPPVSGG